jgi:two-component system LytT family sensor kinase
MAWSAAVVINLGGYIVGAALFGMLMALVLAPPHGVAQQATPPGWPPARRLALMTGLLGVVWNLGALAVDWLRLDGAPVPPWLTMAAYTALGFLPAVVVHLVVDVSGPNSRRGTTLVRWAGVGVATVAAVRHGQAALSGGTVPDEGALLLLTVGYTVLVAALLILTRAVRRSRTLWVGALTVFAVSGFHLTTHDGTEGWWMAVIGHHASLPLGIAILQQHDRFAFADLFLRRALALLLLGAVVLGLLLAVPPVLSVSGEPPAPESLALWLALWMAVAVAYPRLQVVAERVVDTFVLHRPDHRGLRARLAATVAHAQNPEMLWRDVTRELDAAFDAAGVWHCQVDGAPPGAPVVLLGSAARDWVRSGRCASSHDAAAVALVPTVEAPYFAVCLPVRPDRRRLLSDDLELLQTAANLLGRRIDALRVAHERCEQSLREEEISRLATEAELRALRAQLNPHFLFNALTTIGYLIRDAPERAERTLMDLTGVLRAVLRRSSHEFSTLGDEIDIIRAYLDIECARFEQRLVVTMDVPQALRSIPVPSLLLQPLVENAVKHGIAPTRRGGRVSVQASVRADIAGARSLVVEVIDTGAGGTPGALVAGRAQGFGLDSVERRLRTHYGAAAQLTLTTQPGVGTSVEVVLPITAAAVDGVSAPRAESPS